MAVEVPQMKIDPYTSTVPVVQMPVQQMEEGSRPAGPLPGQFGRKGTGALEMGDALFKGILQGHQIKEQRKAAQAQATIAAADSAQQGAYQQYQDALQKAGGKADDPNAQAAYKAYTDVFNQAKQAKAKFVIPEKPAKGQKKDKKDGGGGFANIKDFFEANPHVVPQIALLSMQPKPQGVAPETKQQIQQSTMADLEGQREQGIVQEGQIALEEAKRKQEAQKVWDAGSATFEHLTADDISALPPDAKKNYDTWLHARDIATGTKSTGKAVLWTDGKGNYMSLQPGEVPPAGSGYKPYNNPTGGGGAGSSKLGTLPEVMGQYAKEHGIDPNNMPVAVQKYVKDWYAWKAATTASSSSAPAHLDASGNQVAGSTSTTRGTPEPKPPAGFAPVEGGVAAPVAGRMTPPPSPPSAVGPSARSAAPRGGMTAPPASAARGTWQQSQNTQKVETEKTTRYTNAQKTYDAALKTAQSALDGQKIDQAEFEKRKAAALSQLQAEHQGIEQWYNQQVHAVHGSVPGDSFKQTKLGNGKVQIEVGGKKYTGTQEQIDAFIKEASGAK